MLKNNDPKCPVGSLVSRKSRPDIVGVVLERASTSSSSRCIVDSYQCLVRFPTCSSWFLEDELDLVELPKVLE